MGEKQRPVIPIRKGQRTLCEWFLPPNQCRYPLELNAPSMAREILADPTKTGGEKIPIARRCTVPPGHPDCSGHQDYKGSTRP